MADQGVQYIEEASLGRLRLDDPRTGYVVTKLDLGHPTVRAVTTDRVGAPGSLDDTAFHGARAVSIEVKCSASEDGATSRRAVLDRLRAYTSPGRRPVLVWAEDDGVERRVVLRGENAPLTFDRAPGGIGIPVQLAFVAPEGVLERLAETTATVSAVATPGSGIGFPVRLPFGFPRSSTYGATRVVNGGTEAAPPVIELWGPCTSPVLLNLTTGQRISLPGLTLTAQQYAQVDVAAATIRLNGRASESLYSWQEWGVSVFPWIAPGENLLRYTPTDYGAAAHAAIRFRERSI